MKTTLLTFKSTHRMFILMSPMMMCVCACVCVRYRYKPPPNEVDPSSRLTVMKIQLPTGVEAYLEDLRQFKESDDPLISHYELDGDTVDIQMDSVPSDIFVCVGFRTRTTFTVSGASESLFRVYELHDRGSMCSKMFTSEEHTLQRLCVGQECQCMTAACAVYRGNMDSTLTVEQRQEETCRPHIVYAYRVKVKSSAAEGDFMTYTASVSEVIKRADNQFDAVSGGTELQLVKKATCGTVDIHLGKQYLVMGAHGSVVKLGQNNYKYRLALDSEALVEVWPSDCTANCPRSVNILETYAEIMQTEESCCVTPLGLKRHF
ncbi:hypothetical protein INR49_022881 [Caranx melampygus]|nr:hypothetical protein INR49_022881 [Caranx melampygus]